MASGSSTFDMPLVDHWANAGPSFSYLMDDFTDTPDKPAFFSSQAERCLAATSRKTPSPTTDGSLPDGGGGGANVFHPAKAVSGRFSNATHNPLAQFDHNSAEAFHAMFAPELRERRKGRVAKISMDSPRRRDWYVDKKLMQSHQAEVSLMNELDRLNLREPK